MQNQLESCRTQLEKVFKKQELNDQTYHQVLKKVEQCLKVQQITEILLDYVNKKTAQQLANKFFFALRLDKKKLTKIEEFYQQLRNSGLKGQDLDTIRKYKENGKKRKISQYLTQKFGTIQGKKLFDQYESQFQEKFSQPLLNSKKLHNNKSGLQIYQYPLNYVNQIEKQDAKTLIVLGETGCGKSTFLNSLVNYLADVQLEDPFRYFIIFEDTASQIQSITSEISIYYVKDVRTGISYRVIDTPGFGDTKGFNYDVQNMKRIQNLFKNEIFQLHLVLFLMKSSSTRMTPYHKYIFQSIMDLFDKSVAENFVFVLTFADASQSTAIQWLKDEKDGFGDYWDCIKQPKTIEVNNSGFFQKMVNEKNANMIKNFWDVGTQFMKKLIEKANQISLKSLKITKQLIKQKQSLSLRISETSNKIQRGLVQQQNIRNHIEVILQNQQKIKNNENFEYEIEITVWYAQEVNANVTRCNNCVNSNCHPKCAFGNGQEKKNCAAMNQNGNCQICPLKCHYACHTNSNILRKTKTLKQKQTKDDIKKQFYEATSKMQWYQQSLKKMILSYQKIIDDTKNNMTNITSLQQNLKKISLSKRKPLTTQQYIEFLIAKERVQNKPGALKRIENLNITLGQLKIEESTSRGQTCLQLDARMKVILENLTQNASQKSIFNFNRMKSWFNRN